MSDRKDDDRAAAAPVSYFTIREQHGTIYNVVGDVHIGATPVPAREIAGRLREGLRHPAVGRPTASEAREYVDAIDDAMREDAPDRHRIARSLERLTRLLSTTGTLVAAGAALVDPMTGLAVWLGALGKAVLAELPKS